MSISLLAATAAVLQTVTFDQSTALPGGWTTGITGQGASKWEVIADKYACVRAERAAPIRRGNVLLGCKTNEKIKDGFAEVKIKPVSGKKDQTGRSRMAFSGREQLLRRSRERTGGERGPLQNRQWNARHCK